MKFKIKKADGTYVEINTAEDLTDLAEGDVVVSVDENGNETELTVEETDRLVAEIERRSAEIDDEIENANEAEIDVLEEEVERIVQSRSLLGAIKRKLVRRNIPKVKKRGAFPPASAMAAARQARRTISEARASLLSKTNRMSFSTPEMRSILVSSGNIATPTQVGGINDMFNTVSSIVDLVTVEDCAGMGSYKVAYESAASTAAVQTEGNDISVSEPAFSFVTISPTSIGVLSYVSDQVRRQTPLLYTEKVERAALQALRAKAAAMITAEIYSSTVATSLTISAIDATTLRKIALNYGGNENVMGDAVLFLNKADLIAFGDVRGTNEKKSVYEITPDTGNPNTGIIQDGGLAVRYCINSNCTAFTDATAGETATNTMFYGQPQNYTLGLFGNYEIEVSTDYQFAKRMLSILGTADIGGAVTVKDGFVKVQLAAAA